MKSCKLAAKSLGGKGVKQGHNANSIDFKFEHKGVDRRLTWLSLVFEAEWLFWIPKASHRMHLERKSLSDTK
jgi:hypothetical protein